VISGLEVRRPLQGTGRPAAARVHVLHVLGALNPGGIETWLLQVLRHVDRSRFQFDFLVQSAKPSNLDADVVALGGRIHTCPYTRRPTRYARRFRQILRHSGPYDAVHSHVHAFSGFVLALAALHRVPIRIAHSHTTAEGEPFRRSPARWLYAAAMRRAIRTTATHGFACAESAARVLFGPGWRDDPRWSVLRCGIDPTPFEKPGPAEPTRESLDLAADALVVGHVGNFRLVKNHEFLLRVFRELVRIHPDSYLLLVGDGPLRETVQREVQNTAVERRVRFLGHRRDVPAVMRHLFDVFVLPSRLEGLPLVLVEAQAAGLPCVISEVVTREADIPGATVERLPLGAPLEDWARAILSHGLLQQRSLRTGRSPVRGTAFDVSSGARQLELTYAAHRTSGRVESGLDRGIVENSEGRGDPTS